MSARPVLVERQVTLSPIETLRIAAEQGRRGGIVITLGVIVQRGPAVETTPAFDLPPRSLRDVAAALQQLAGQLEGETSRCR